MRTLFFLIGLPVLALGAGCPAMLEGLNLNDTTEETPSPAMLGLPIKLYSLSDAVDVACGRSNFTAAFWSNYFLQGLIMQVVECELDRNGTLADLRPLAQSLKDQYAALEDEEAKAYVDDFLKHHRKNRRRKMTATRIMKEIIAVMGLNFAHILPTESQIALTQATKRAFGVVETVEVKQQRIDIAASAIERHGVLRGNESMADLFVGMYEMTKSNYSMGISAFELFANDLENAWNETKSISYLEVAPAVETLYLQYNSLNNTQAKDFVDWFLASMVVPNPTTKSTNFIKENDHARTMYNKAYDEYDNVKGVCKSLRVVYMHDPITNAKTCYNSLPYDAQTAIRSTFPEVFSYLENQFSIDKWAYGQKRDGSIFKEFPFKEVRDKSIVRSRKEKLEYTTRPVTVKAVKQRTTLRDC